MKKFFSLFYIVSVVLIASLAVPMYSEAAISEEGHWYEDIDDFDTYQQDICWDKEVDYSDEALAELINEYYDMKKEIKKLDTVKASLSSSKADDEKELLKESKKKGLFSSILSIMEEKED